MSDFQKENSQFANDLDWMAFCYIANELNGKQLADFESRLETDQEARDAVVRAMELATDVYQSDPSACSQSVGTRADSGVGRDSIPANESPKVGPWLAVAAVVAGLLIGLTPAIKQFWDKDQVEQVVAENAAEALAEVWVDSLDEAAEITLVDFTTELEDEFEFRSDSDSEGEDWMLIALNELESTESEN